MQMEQLKKDKNYKMDKAFIPTNEGFYYKNKKILHDYSR